MKLPSDECHKICIDDIAGLVQDCSISSALALNSQNDPWIALYFSGLAPCLNIKNVFSPGMGIPMLKIKRAGDCLINMGIPILVRRYLYIDTAPRWHHYGMVIMQSCTKPSYVNIGSGNVPSGNKTLPEPMWTNSYDVIWYYQGPWAN